MRTVSGLVTVQLDLIVESRLEDLLEILESRLGQAQCVPCYRYQV